MSRLLANPLSIYLAFVGIGLLVAAVALLMSRAPLAIRGERAQGQIVGYTERLGSRRGERVQFMPIVRYSPRGAGAIEFQSRMGSDSQPFAVGELVAVRYRFDKPEVAEIDSAARLWLAPAVIAGMSVSTLYAAWKAGAPH